MRKQKMKERKNAPRCYYSGKLIYPSKKAILLEYIQEFLIKSNCDIIYFYKKPNWLK